jgi:hypothetical protein
LVHPLVSIMRLAPIAFTITCGLAVVAPSWLLAAPRSRLREQGRVSLEVEARVNQTLAAYTAGDDLAVEHWMSGLRDRSTIAAIVTAVVTPKSAWSRARAAFVLEVAVAVPAGSAILKPNLLQAGLTLVTSRPDPLGSDPVEDRFEVLWHQAALGVAQGTQQFWFQHDYLDGIGPRFEAARQHGVTLDTRFPLARAIASAGLCCWKRVPGATIQLVAPSERPKNTADDAIALFARAADIPALRNEALIRGAVALRAAGRDAEALAWLGRVPADTDRALGYMHHMTLARLLDAANRAADAAAAYRTALGFAPLNQPAAIGLSAALLRAGNDEEAVRAAAGARRMPPDPVDQSREFKQADARFVGEWLLEIRRLRR